MYKIYDIIKSIFPNVCTINYHPNRVLCSTAYCSEKKKLVRRSYYKCIYIYIIQYYIHMYIILVDYYITRTHTTKLYDYIILCTYI